MNTGNSLTIRDGLNRTKVGLKHIYVEGLEAHDPSLNRTKVGLKHSKRNLKTGLPGSLNRTKVGLKRTSELDTEFVLYTTFESH